MSGNFSPTADVGVSTAPELQPITQESPQLLAAAESMKALLSSLAVTPMAGGNKGTLSVGDVAAQIDSGRYDEGNSVILFQAPIAALDSISVTPINEALMAKLAENPFIQQNFDLTKDRTYNNSVTADAAALLKEIKDAAPAELTPELTAKLDGWLERNGKEGHHGFYISDSSSTVEDEKNRVSFSITAEGVSPKDDAIAAKDFVSENVMKRKDAILQAVIQSANELNAKHIEEKGTPLFNPEELESLKQLDLVSEDASYGRSGHVSVVFGTKKQHMTPECKDTPKDQLDATPLSKLHDDVRREIISKALLTAGENAQELYPFIADSETVLKELHAALGNNAEFTAKIDALHKAAEIANKDFKDQDAERAKRPHIAVRRAYATDTKSDEIEISIPIPEGMTAQQVLEGIAQGKAVSAAPNALDAFINQAAAGKLGREDGTCAPGNDPNEPGYTEPKPDGEMKVAGGKNGTNHETPVSVEPPPISEPPIKAPKIGPDNALEAVSKASPDSVEPPKIGPAPRATDKPGEPGTAPTVREIAQASSVVTEASLAAEKLAAVPKGGRHAPAA